MQKPGLAEEEYSFKDESVTSQKTLQSVTLHPQRFLGNQANESQASRRLATEESQRDSYPANRSTYKDEYNPKQSPSQPADLMRPTLEKSIYGHSQTHTETKNVLPNDLISQRPNNYPEFSHT